jgi:hypothetical protein
MHEFRYSAATPCKPTLSYVASCSEITAVNVGCARESSWVVLRECNTINPLHGGRDNILRTLRRPKHPYVYTCMIELAGIAQEPASTALSTALWWYATLLSILHTYFRKISVLLHRFYLFSSTRRLLNVLIDKKHYFNP